MSNREVVTCNGVDITPQTHLKMSILDSELDAKSDRIFEFSKKIIGLTDPPLLPPPPPTPFQINYT